ncbi:LacI family DNA-binding transcriptional regulator [Pseudonocardia bannensis]|uniref:LacI family transcriptional regulator n=1 Tax=Pseudonocardia bannensis TaxID=630973 RepID=A0A848DHY6_9PSEU|nr:LacI family DNA-binding transcriptional regulator [Pseudonocardia bannensis]NMH92292.1 LacI family transcriptional regulator [Pseudonocardia bannensis]
MVEPGRRPRLEDVAAAVGLSTASVSLVLRGAPGPSAKTRERVLDAAARLGYRPDRAASLLARRRSRLIGVVMDVRSTFHAELVEDVHDVAERHGYDLVLSTRTRTRDERRAIETLVDSRCEALVLLGPETPAPRLAALDRQLPVVAVGRRFPAAGLDVVRVADDEGVGQAVAHLTELGHRDIAYVDGGPGTIATDRRRGYQHAMRRARLVDRARVVPGDHTEEAGSRAARALLDAGELPTAVVTFNDRCAVGLLDTFSRAGVDVPGMVSVAGYDDSPLSRLAHVELTTVGQDTRGLTEHAVAAVVERLDGGRAEHREVVLTAHLVVRRTTGPPRG